MKLFNNRDEKDCKCVARAERHTDGKKSDCDNDPRVVALQEAAWGGLGFTNGHGISPRYCSKPLNHSGAISLWEHEGGNLAGEP
jgi:hypothetical protein